MNDYEALTDKEKQILNDDHKIRLDLKKVARMRAMIYPTKSYAEELLMPRYSSVYRYVISPIIFSALSATYGYSKSVYQDLPRNATILRYAKRGLAWGVPYYFLNEVITGLLIRIRDEEQYFFSHSSTSLLLFVGAFSTQFSRRAITKKPFQTILSQAFWPVTGLFITSTWLEMFYIVQRDTVLKRIGNLRSTEAKKVPLSRKDALKRKFLSKVPGTLGAFEKKEKAQILRELTEEIESFERLKNEAMKDLE